MFLFQCQYIFVHDALLHFIESGFQLSIPIDELKDHVQKLRKNCSSTSGLEVEFEVSVHHSEAGGEGKGWCINQFAARKFFFVLI